MIVSDLPTDQQHEWQALSAGPNHELRSRTGLAVTDRVVLKDAAGRPFKVVKFATDVTRRIKLEKEAEEQREKTRQLIQEVIESSNQFAEGARVVHGVQLDGDAHLALHHAAATARDPLSKSLTAEADDTPGEP